MPLGVNIWGGRKKISEHNEVTFLSPLRGTTFLVPPLGGDLNPPEGGPIDPLNHEKIKNGKKYI